MIPDPEEDGSSLLRNIGWSCTSLTGYIRSWIDWGEREGRQEVKEDEREREGEQKKREGREVERGKGEWGRGYRDHVSEKITDS